MAGTKTRFGYFGSGGEDPPEAGEAGAARTVIGRDLHLPQIPPEIAPASTPLSPGPFPPVRGPMAPSERDAVAEPMTEAVTAAIRERPGRRSRPSRFAGFLGRWTTGGHFRSSHGADASEVTDDDLKLPRETAARNLLLVLAIAALTFLVTFAVMKWREPRAAAPVSEPPARMAAPRLLPTTVPGAVPVVAPAPAPSPATSAPLPPTAPSAAARVPAPLARANPTLRPHKNPREPKPGPASMPPDHLKDELLPLNP